MAAITSEKVCPTCKRTYWRRVRWEDLNDDPAQCSDCSDVALTKRIRDTLDVGNPYVARGDFRSEVEAIAAKFPAPEGYLWQVSTFEEFGGQPGFQDYETRYRATLDRKGAA